MSGFCDSLRDGLKTRMGICPTCGVGDMHQREMARLLNVSPAILSRFLGGKAPSAMLVDRLVEYLEILGTETPE